MAERDYRRALAGKLASLKISGETATLSSDLARGDPQVSDLKYKSEAAWSNFTADKMVVEYHKLRIEIDRTLDVWERYDRFEGPDPGH